MANRGKFLGSTTDNSPRGYLGGERVERRGAGSSINRWVRRHGGAFFTPAEAVPGRSEAAVPEVAPVPEVVVVVGEVSRQQRRAAARRAASAGEANARRLAKGRLSAAKSNHLVAKASEVIR
jgi:hypothetical protein